MSTLRNVVGIDISSTAVRAALVSRRQSGPSTVVERLAARKLPAGMVSEGRITSSRHVSAALSEVLRDVRAPRLAPVAVAVSGSHTAVRWVRIPAGFKPEERAEHVRRSVGSLSPTVPTKDAALSVVTVGGDDEHVDVAVAGITRKHLAAVENVTAAADRMLVTVDLSAAALLRSTVRPDGEHVACVIDVGATHTTVALRVGPRLRWVDTVPQGGQSITAALTAVGMSEQEAEEAKRTMSASDHAPELDRDADDVWDEHVVGNGSTERTRTLAQQQLTASVDDLLDRVATAIENRVRSDGVEPAGILLAGRGSLIRGMNERLSARTELPVHGCLPWVEISANETNRALMQIDPALSGGDQERHVASPATLRAFAVAVGMALTPAVA